MHGPRVAPVRGHQGQQATKQAVKQQPATAAPPIPNMDIAKWSGAVFWLFGLTLTTAFIHGLAFDILVNQWYRWPVEIVVSLALQVALTKLESPIWRGYVIHLPGLLGLGIDVYINLAGAFAIADGIATSESTRVLAGWYGWNMNEIKAGNGFMLTTVCIAVLIAALPELLWTLDKRVAQFKHAVRGRMYQKED